jgi:DNA-binding IclR family transcriptional regulator
VGQAEGKADISTDASQYRIKSAYDALRLLELIATSENWMNASEIAALVGENRNRVFRLLRTLEEAGYVRQDPTTRAYQPTFKLVSLGYIVSRSGGFETQLLKTMGDLQKLCGETVYLVGHDGDHAVSLMSIESNHLNRISMQPGTRWPLGYGAAGQALLLAAPNKEDYLARHPEIRATWHRVEEQFRRDGVTFVDGRYDRINDDGIVAIGTPLASRSTGQLLALAVTWPLARETTTYDEVRRMLLDAVEELGQTFTNNGA